MINSERHIILETRDLAVGYFRKKDANTIAASINFSAAAGELIGLVGANGIGKSTLLRTLAGMQQELSGSILIKGNPISNYTSLQLANQLSIVLTEVPASKNLTVYELIALGRQPYTNWMGKLHKNDLDAISFAMEATETTSLAQRKCYELSDGQLQRVYVARALAQDTPVIILDEPTTHLDLYHRGYILKLLKKLSSDANKCILYSTHEIDLAIQLSDKMLIMMHGETLYDTPESLIQAGRFDDLFPSEIIDFDGKTGRFTIKE